jgi:predicted lipid-binding transport protein (Tim44 family)
MLLMAVSAWAFMPDVAEAKRFGGGASKGMQRSAPAKPAPQQPPAQQAAQPAPQAPAAAPAAAGTAAAAAGAAGKRSWLGPVAGLAAGLGLAALASHLGFGEELASFMMIALLALVAVVVVRMVMRRMAGPQPALAGAAGAGGRAGQGGGAAAAAWGSSVSQRSMELPAHSGADTPARAAAAAQSPSQPAAEAATPGYQGLQIGSAVPQASFPADFDREGFERIARMIFVRMQAAHDAADLDDLRQFTTPELFAEIRLDIQDRGASAQHTDVQAIAAEAVAFAEEDGRRIVSVRYTGRVLEEAGAEPTPVDETWHLVQPVDGSRSWAIAGIQQAV